MGVNEVYCGTYFLADSYRSGDGGAYMGDFTNTDNRWDCVNYSDDISKMYAFSIFTRVSAF